MKVEVQFVGAAQARRLNEAALHDREEARIRDALNLLRVFHDRHIGLPPELANELSAAFPPHGSPDAEAGLRGAIYARLLQAIGVDPKLVRDPRHFDILPRQIIVHDCLLPLAALAVEAIGRTLLFCEDDDLPEIEPHAYENYLQAFRAALETLCATSAPDAETTSIDIFWERAAVKLWAAVRRQRRAGAPLEGGSLQMAEPDGMVLRFVYGLKPEPRIGADPRRIRPIMADEQNPQFTYPRQGGVVDIHSTRRPEDIDDFLISEFMWPPAILADRLLNGSNLAKHRPPPFDERRQILVVGASVDEPVTPPLAIARVAWLDALFRFSIMLHKSNLRRSQLRFGQWLPGSGIAHSALSVADYPQLGKFDFKSVGRLQMCGFFRDAGWLPGFVATRPQHTLAADSPAVASGDDERTRRFNLLMEKVAPELSMFGAESAGGDGVDLNLALVTVFTAGDDRHDDFAWHSRLGNPALPVHSLRVHCPEALQPGSSFTLECHPANSRLSTTVSLPSTALDKAALEQLSATLCERIFEFLWEDMIG
ncbi:hypothetical protein [Stappia indica]|uniref:Uncharacterized protein n=1 Tax=Stappia indica TaxID=538381 RepID=A0A857CCI9_9HYPH|nr:hypothetical protein [Stappia indica]QGZ36724.1 hypothetical protein GH266_20815 [Stappia indica]